MPKSFRKTKTNPPPPPPPLPKDSTNTEDDLCSPPLLVIHKSPLRNKSKVPDSKLDESNKKEPKLPSKQQQKITKEQLQKQQKINKEQARKSSKIQKDKSKKSSKETPPSATIKVSMSPKPEDRDVEVKYTIRRSISGKSTNNENNGGVRMRVVSRSPSSRTSSRLSNYSDTRRKDPLPPRAPLSSGRRSRTTSCSGSSETGSRQDNGLEVEPLQRRHSPEGGEQSPRRGSGLSDPSIARPKELPVGVKTPVSSPAKRSSNSPTTTTYVLPDIDNSHKRLSNTSPDTVSSPVNNPSSYVVMKAYTSPTATISAGPTLTMAPPKSDQNKHPPPTLTKTKDYKSPHERPPLKNTSTITTTSIQSPPSDNAPSPPTHNTKTTTSKSPYARPDLNVNTTSSTDSKSPYAEPVVLSSAGSGLVKPKLISPYARPVITIPGDKHLQSESTKRKLTSPYQKPTVLITKERQRMTSSLHDDVFNSPETPPPPPPDLEITPLDTPLTTPPQQISPYSKPAPPTRCSTLRPQSSATVSSDASNCMTLSSFSRHTDLRSSFISPPTPLKDRDEYNRKVETIYAIPTDEVPELYRFITVKYN